MDWALIETWPHAKMSRRITGPVHRWHVQETGQGPTVLLLHGAGGSTHSWRDVLPRLGQTHHVIALDLPGQGFSQLGARHRCGLDAMATDIRALLEQEGWHPHSIIGHSAGAAVALRLSMDLRAEEAPRIVGINPALAEFDGLAGLVFPVMAKALAATPFVARLFSGASASPARIQNLIQATGSALTAEGLELYRRLVADRTHVDGTLLMMAQWNLRGLNAHLPEIAAHTTFLTGANDKTVPPQVSEKAAMRMPQAKVIDLGPLGHLAHEEDPERISDMIAELL